jgi:hypothetical protein
VVCKRTNVPGRFVPVTYGRSREPYTAFFECYTCMQAEWEEVQRERADEGGIVE